MDQNPERVSRLANPYRVSNLFFCNPGFSFLEPWAEISERLRRYVRRPLTPAALAKLANVCGVEVNRRAPAENEEEDNGKDRDVHQ